MATIDTYLNKESIKNDIRRILLFLKIINFFNKLSFGLIDKIEIKYSCIEKLIQKYLNDKRTNNWIK